MCWCPKMNSLLVILVLGLKYCAGGSEGNWNYEHQDVWPGVCPTGKQQSPINLDPSSAVRDLKGVRIKGPLNFRGYEDVMLVPKNNGKTLEWELDVGWSPPVVSGGPLPPGVNYTFAQFHLHWLSEHAIDGRKYPLEIHFVHIRSGLTPDEALRRPDGLAVVATMCEVYAATGPNTERTEYALQELMESVPEIMKPTSGELEPRRLNMKRLFSPKREGYYTYQGSLTTPNCSEVVTWIVMDTPLVIADTQIATIHKVDISDRTNFRALQPTNRRMVYRSTGSSITPSILLLLASSFAWLATELKKGICAIVNKKQLLVFGSQKDCLELNVIM